MVYRDYIRRTVAWMEHSAIETFHRELNLACGTLVCVYCEALGAHLRGCQKERGEFEKNFVAFIRS